MYKKEILLQSRGRGKDTNKLLHIKNHLYRLESEHYYRTGKLPNGNEYVDPAGGPFLTKGFRIPNEPLIVEEVDGCYITVRRINDLPCNEK